MAGEQKALVKNAADKEQVKKAASKEKRQRDRDLDDVQFVLGTERGRRFIYRIINDLCHYDMDD